MANIWGSSGNSEWSLIFLGSKITAGGDCSHEIKRCLLLGRKVMTNLDSILKSRDITLPTKVHLVKAMVFPVVLYGCESWDYKESSALKNWCFQTVVLEKTLESPLDYKEIQPVHPKGNQSWIFFGRTMLKLKLQYFGHLIKELTPWKRPWCWERLKAGAEGDNRGWVVGWHHRLDGHEFQQALWVGDGQGSLACCSPWAHKELETTEQLNYTEFV